MSIRGVDLASYQGEPDFDAMKAAGIEFVLIKATEGLNYQNPHFHRNWSEAKRVGMVRIAYHFGRPSKNAALAERSYFWAYVGPIEAGDGAALDMEDTAVAATANLAQWSYDWLRDGTFNPLLYSGDWFAKPHGLEGDARLAAFGLWWASYQALEPDAPPPWPFIAIWQNSDRGIVPGVAGPVDTDLFFGTVEQLRSYGAPDSAPTPQPDPKDEQIEVLRQAVAAITADRDALSAIVTAVRRDVAVV